MANFLAWERTEGGTHFHFDLKLPQDRINTPKNLPKTITRRALINWRRDG